MEISFLSWNKSLRNLMKSKTHLWEVLCLCWGGGQGEEAKKEEDCWEEGHSPVDRSLVASNATGSAIHVNHFERLVWVWLRSFQRKILRALLAVVVKERSLWEQVMPGLRLEWDFIQEENYVNWSKKKKLRLDKCKWWCGRRDWLRN
jgi:hypothetical protein